MGDLDLDKLEKLIIKIAVFSLLYTFPAALHIGAQFYESWWRSEATKQVSFLIYIICHVLSSITLHYIHIRFTFSQCNLNLSWSVFMKF